MSSLQLVVRYTAFAIVAIFANLCAQRAVLAITEESLSAGHSFAAAVLAGTAVGLLVKYILDKYWIFHDRSAGLATQGRRFAAYTLTGVITTAIFWGTETAFWLVWRTDLMRELGAVLGLGCGYVLKYRLDRRFVFTTAIPARA